MAKGVDVTQIYYSSQTKCQVLGKYIFPLMETYNICIFLPKYVRIESLVIIRKQGFKMEYIYIMEHKFVF